MKICVRKLTAGFFAVLLIIINGGCSGNQDPAPVVRPQAGSDLCDEVSAKLGPDGMNCDFAYPVPVQQDGPVVCGQDDCVCPEPTLTGCISFEAWCVEQHRNGVFWNTSCIMEKVETCGQVETLCNVQ